MCQRYVLDLGNIGKSSELSFCHKIWISTFELNLHTRRPLLSEFGTAHQSQKNMCSDHGNVYFFRLRNELVGQV